jgi:hypothetical protein
MAQELQNVIHRIERDGPMKMKSKNHPICEDVLVEPGKFLPVENILHENESFRMIEIKTLSNGQVSAQAVFVQKPVHA